MASDKAGAPPLADEQTERLLVPHEVVRDPVHGDIGITALERRIIDTTCFQRLRNVNQLGPCHLVYPGAVHSRFLHSLGTLHCAERLINFANDNYDVYCSNGNGNGTSDDPHLMRVDPYPHLLVRLTALLHDVAHLPFGHTLEDEGSLLPPEWEDSARAELWLGADSPQSIAPVIAGFLEEAGVEEVAAAHVVEDIRRYILHKGNPFELEYPYVADLVGNTLCADLLDYLDRDMFFCGLNERSGDRVVTYIAVVRVGQPADGARYLPSPDNGGKGRVVLLAYRFEHEHLAEGPLRVVPKPEILSEAIDLLRRRFALAEKVYFHRTKLAASALLIAAAGAASLDWPSIYRLSDMEFLGLLRSDAAERTRRLVEAYESRRLYRPVYRLQFKPERDTDESSRILWNEVYPRCRRPEWRLETETLLETYSGLPPGSVAVYCPERGMNLKRFEMLVHGSPEGEIKPLEEILDENRRAEMNAINERFEQLWEIQVFVDPEVLDARQVNNEQVQDFSQLCEETIGFPNDIPALRNVGRPLREQVAARVINEWESAQAEKVPFDTFEELVNAPHRSEGNSLLESMRDHLRSLMAN